MGFPGKIYAVIKEEILFTTMEVKMMSTHDTEKEAWDARDMWQKQNPNTYYGVAVFNFEKMLRRE